MSRTKTQASSVGARISTRADRAKGGRNTRKSMFYKVMETAPRTLENITETPELIARRLRGSPIGMALLAGAGSFILGRFLIKYYQNHPEIGEFVRENFDSVGAKIRDFRGADVDTDVNARH